MSDSAQSPLPPPGQSPEWLLVVDDERAICEMVRAAYLDSGVEVEVAQGTAEAEAVLVRRKTAPLVVISDAVLPGDDGMAFVRGLAARLPRTKVVLMSRHLSELAWWPPELRSATILAKPFRLHGLWAVLADARRERGG